MLGVENYGLGSGRSDPTKNHPLVGQAFISKDTAQAGALQTLPYENVLL
jgi:hypothetical protein